MVTDLEDQQQPRPEFDVSTPNVFKVIMFASGHTDNRLRELGLNDRQVGAIHYLRLKDTITTAEYQSFFNASNATAKRDLGDLVGKRFIIREGKASSSKYKGVESG